MGQIGKPSLRLEFSTNKEMLEFIERTKGMRPVATPPAPGWTWLERVGILAIAAIALYVAFKLL